MYLQSQSELELKLKNQPFLQIRPLIVAAGVLSCPGVVHQMFLPLPGVFFIVCCCMNSFVLSV